MYSLDFWLAVAILAAVPFWMAAYGGHVAAESISDSKHRRYVRLKFWGIGLIGLVVAFAYQYRVTKSDEAKLAATQKWQLEISAKLDQLKPKSDEQQKAVIELKKKVANAPGEKIRPLTLKQLFETDFNVQRVEYPGTLTFMQDLKNPLVLPFVARQWRDSNANSKFVTIYSPAQDSDPDKATSRNLDLCALIETNFGKIMGQLDGLQEEGPPPGIGNIRKSTDLKFTGRIIIYHEDFMRPQDIGDLIRNYSERGLSLEFRGHDYLATEELRRAIFHKK